MKTCLAAIAAVPLVVSLPLLANTSTEYTLVTATRIEQLLSETLSTAHVVEFEDIEKMQPSNFASLLDRVSGVGFQDSGGQGSVSGLFIRGTNLSQVVVLIDGMRTASATLGATALEGIPLESIERIEVVKGPLSGLYGADALGGVVQVFTKRGSGEGINAGVNVGYGSHDTESVSAFFSGGNEDYSFYANIAGEDVGGIDRTSLKTGGNQDRDSFDRTSGHLSLSARLTDSLQGQFTYLKNQSESQFDNLFGVDSGYYSETAMESASVQLSYQASQQLNLMFMTGYLSDRIETPAFGSDITTRRRSGSLQANFRPDADNLWVAGTDYYTDKVETLAAFAETQRDNTGYFVQWQGSFDQISTVVSLRYDDNEAYGDDSNGSIGVGYTLDNGIKLIASAGTAFKAPTFNDLYYPYYGNPDVLPEETQSYELSARGDYAGGVWRLSAFRSNVSNLIGYDVSTYSANNISDATLEGIEVEYSRYFGVWNFSSNLEYLDAYDDNSGDFLNGRARVSANMQLGRDFKDVYAGIDMKAEHGRYQSAGQRLPGYGLLGLSLVYKISDNLKLSARLDNVFDRKYILNQATSVVYYETEGRTAKVNLQYQFQ